MNKTTIRGVIQTEEEIMKKLVKQNFLKRLEITNADRLVNKEPLLTLTEEKLEVIATDFVRNANLIGNLFDNLVQEHATTMKEKRKVYTLERKFASALSNILAHKGVLIDAGDDELIERIIIDFEDSNNMSLEIDINNGGRDDNSSPYININWYRNGTPFFNFSLQPVGLIGQYILEDGENKIRYIAELAIGKTGQTFRI